MTEATFAKGKLLEVCADGSIGKMHLSVFADWCKGNRPGINWVAEFKRVCTDSKTVAFRRGNAPYSVTDLSYRLFEQLDHTVVSVQVHPTLANDYLKYLLISRLAENELRWSECFEITNAFLVTQSPESLGEVVVIAADQFHSKVPLKDREQIKAASVVAKLLQLESVWVFIPEPQAA